MSLRQLRVDSTTPRRVVPGSRHATSSPPSPSQSTTLCTAPAVVLHQPVPGAVQLAAPKNRHVGKGPVKLHFGPEYHNVCRSCPASCMCVLLHSTDEPHLGPRRLLAVKRSAHSSHRCSCLPAHGNAGLFNEGPLTKEPSQFGQHKPYDAGSILSMRRPSPARHAPARRHTCWLTRYWQATTQQYPYCGWVATAAPQPTRVRLRHTMACPHTHTTTIIRRRNNGTHVWHGSRVKDKGNPRSPLRPCAP